MLKLIPIVKKLYTSYLVRNYHSEIDPARPNVLISYIPFTLRWPPTHRGFEKHQNRRNSVAIVRAFEKLGFNVDVVYFSKKLFLPKGKYRIVFGLEPNFERYCRENPEALKIYYATGSYWKYQNSAEINRIREVNQSRHCSLSPQRLVREHKSPEIADWIFQIGSNYTVNTYPPELRRKVVLVGQSSVIGSKKLDREDYGAASSNFVWFGGNGSVLKGLDLCIEAFTHFPDAHLHVIGKIDADFMKEYANELMHNANVHTYGWLGIESQRLRDVVSLCGFVLLPSASEGMPGSVLAMMNYGLVPVVSLNACYDGFEDFALILEKISIQPLLQAIEKAKNMSPEDLALRSRKSYEFSQRHFTPDNYGHNFEKALHAALGSKRDSCEDSNPPRMAWGKDR